MMDIQDHKAKAGWDWFKESWKMSQGARIPFFFLTLFFGLLLSPELLISQKSLLTVILGVLSDLLGVFVYIGTLLFVSQWAQEKKLSLTNFIKPLKAQVLKKMAPLLLLSLVLSTLTHVSKLDEHWIALEISLTLLSLFLAPSFALRAFYDLSLKKALSASFMGTLLNFWALLVSELALLLMCLLGLGIPLLTYPLLSYVSFKAIFSPSRPMPTL